MVALKMSSSLSQAGDAGVLARVEGMVAEASAAGAEAQHWRERAAALEATVEAIRRPPARAGLTPGSEPSAGRLRRGPFVIVPPPLSFILESL
jgi:hypothetical protein